MSDGINPYQAPASSPAAVGVLSGKLADVRKVAYYQKGINGCILAYFIILALIYTTGNDQSIATRLLVAIAAGTTGVLAFIFTMLLATQVYGLGLGIVLGVLTLIPCLGLLVLLMVNQRATTLLKENGFSVGMLGASLAEIDARIAAGGPAS